MKEYGIWNSVQKRFVFGIKESSKKKAIKALENKVGIDVYKWRYSIRTIPENWRNPKNPNYEEGEVG